MGPKINTLLVEHEDPAEEEKKAASPEARGRSPSPSLRVRGEDSHRRETSRGSRRSRASERAGGDSVIVISSYYMEGSEEEQEEEEEEESNARAKEDEEAQFY